MCYVRDGNINTSIFDFLCIHTYFYSCFSNKTQCKLIVLFYDMWLVAQECESRITFRAMHTEWVNVMGTVYFPKYSIIFSLISKFCKNLDTYILTNQTEGLRHMPEPCIHTQSWLTIQRWNGKDSNSKAEFVFMSTPDWFSWRRQEHFLKQLSSKQFSFKVFP